MKIFPEEEMDVFSCDYGPMYRIVFIEAEDGDPADWKREVMLVWAEDVEEVLELAKSRALGRLWALALKVPVQSPDREPNSYVLNWLSGLDPRISADLLNNRFKRMQERAHQGPGAS